MAIDPTVLKKKIALADLTPEERDYLLNRYNTLLDIGRDLQAATVSCTGLDITIACDDHDIKDRLMRFLCGG